MVPLKSCWVMIFREKKIAVKFRMIIGLAIMYWADLEVKIRLSPVSTQAGFRDMTVWIVRKLICIWKKRYFILNWKKWVNNWNSFKQLLRIKRFQKRILSSSLHLVHGVPYLSYYNILQLFVNFFYKVSTHQNKISFLTILSVLLSSVVKKSVIQRHQRIS